MMPAQTPLVLLIVALGELAGTVVYQLWRYDWRVHEVFPLPYKYDNTTWDAAALAALKLLAAVTWCLCSCRTARRRSPSLPKSQVVACGALLLGVIASITKGVLLLLADLDQFKFIAGGIGAASLAETGLVAAAWLQRNSDYELLPLSINHMEGPESSGFVSQMTSSTMLYRLIKMSMEDRWKIFIATACMVLAVIGQTGIPHFTGKVIDDVAIKDDTDAARQDLVLLVGWAFLTAIFTGLRNATYSRCIYNLQNRLRLRLFQSLLAQEIGFFDSQKTGEITSRLTSDTTKMGDAIGNNLNVFLRSCVQVVGTLGFMLLMNWKLTTLTFVIVPLVVIVSQRYGQFNTKLGKRTQELLAQANAIAEEACSAMKTVRSFAAEEAECRSYAKRTDELAAVQLRACLASGTYLATVTFLPNLVVAAILLYGGYLVKNKEITGGQLVTFLLYQVSLTDTFNNIGWVYTSLSEAFGAGIKVFELMDRQPQIRPSGSLSPPHISGEVKFTNISFAYPTRAAQRVLQGFSLTVRPGEVIALVGPSGGGKSTVINLLQRFYDPLLGTVTMDGCDLSEYDHAFFHRRIGIVGQEPVLFARSVRENILFGLDEPISEEKLIEVCTLANALDFINELPEKFDTFVGEKGVQLSGGQKQRIAIARALVRDPTVLLLDEATSALDSQSEFVVQEAIDRIMRNRTVIIVAHRLSTIRNADRVLVIQRGVVVEEGPHSELMSVPKGIYRELVSRQIHDQQHPLAAAADIRE